MRSHGSIPRLATLLAGALFVMVTGVVVASSRDFQPLVAYGGVAQDESTDDPLCQGGQRTVGAQEQWVDGQHCQYDDDETIDDECQGGQTTVGAPGQWGDGQWNQKDDGQRCQHDDGASGQRDDA